MKKIYTLIVMTFCVTLANATTHSVQVLASSFSPPNTTAVCGDTILWTWTGGSHTTTSINVPGCATGWDSPIDASTTSFFIVIPCTGNYTYQCTPHGFLGSITVTTCPSGIDAPEAGNPVNISPNPSATGIFNVMFTDLGNQPQRIYVVGTDGRKIIDASFSSATKNHIINLQSHAMGIYFLVTEGENGRRVYKMVR